MNKPIAPIKDDATNYQFSISQKLSLLVLYALFAYTLFSVEEFVQFGFVQMDMASFIIPSIIGIFSYLVISGLAILLFQKSIADLLLKEKPWLINRALYFSFYYFALYFLILTGFTILLTYIGYTKVLSNPSSGLTFLTNTVGHIQSQLFAISVVFTILGFIPFFAIFFPLIKRVYFDRSYDNRWIILSFPIFLTLGIGLTLLFSSIFDGILLVVYVIFGLFFGGRGGW